MDWILFLTAVAGIILHLLKEYADSLTQKEKLNFKRSVIYGIAAIILMLVIVWNIDEAGKLFGIEITGVTIFFIGYSSDSLIKGLSKYSPFKKE